MEHQALLVLMEFLELLAEQALQEAVEALE
jgi:hypothetical protein